MENIAIVGKAKVVMIPRFGPRHRMGLEKDGECHGVAVCGRRVLARQVGIPGSACSVGSILMPLLTQHSGKDDSLARSDWQLQSRSSPRSR